MSGAAAPARGRSAIGTTLRALPTLLRVGLAEAIAYRAETVVWMLTNTMPLVNLALWHAITRDGPIGGYGQPEVTGYFLAALIVRQLTGSWVMWEMTREIRMGTLSMRLLRPVHPLVTYAAENLSAMPLRAGFVVPFALVIAFALGPEHVNRDPLVWLAIPAALAGAWLITFFTMAAMGALGFWIESALGVFEVWLALYFTLSGYLFPLAFFEQLAPWAPGLIRRLPFFFMNGFPVEMIIGKLAPADVLAALAAQWAWVAFFFGATVVAFRLGLRRYGAYGA